MGKYKKLLNNSIIFAIGNLGSKLITIILVPIYTFYFSTAEYGEVDIITTSISMLLPIISLSIYEGVFRYSMDKNYPRQEVFSTSFLISLIGSVFTFLIYPLLRITNLFQESLEYMLIILTLQSFQTLFAQFSRAIGKIKTYALNGIISTFVLGSLNILLIVYFRLGINGYFLSLILSNAISIVFFLIASPILKNLKISSINKKISKSLLIYSIPLIPNSFMWWIMSASNRYFILYYEGIKINGLFAVANKIPTLLTILILIFNQAWQLSAIEEFDSENKSKFFSQVFLYYKIALIIGTSAILLILKPLLKVAISPDYYLSWKYVPFLLLGVVFSSFSGFLGNNYIAAKETKGVFKSSLIGGIISLCLNALIIPFLGGIGAGISIAISYFVIWTIRTFDSKKLIIMEYSKKRTFIMLSIICLQIAILFFNLKLSYEILINLILFLILIVINIKQIKNLFEPFLHKS